MFHAIRNQKFSTLWFQILHKKTYNKAETFGEYHSRKQVLKLTVLGWISS